MSYIWRIRNEVPETNQCTVDLKIHEFGLLWSRRIHLTEPFKVYSMKLSQLITKIFGYIKISSLIFIVLLGIYGLIIGVGDLTIWTYPKRLTLLIIMRDIRQRGLIQFKNEFIRFFTTKKTFWRMFGETRAICLVWLLSSS